MSEAWKKDVFDRIIEEFDPTSKRSLHVPKDIWTIIFDEEPEDLFALGTLECKKGTIGVSYDETLDNGCWKWKSLEDLMTEFLGLSALIGTLSKRRTKKTKSD